MTMKDVSMLAEMESYRDVMERLFLTDRQRDIARLRFEGGLYNQEIADRLNVSLAVVKKECRVIKRKLEAISFL